MNSILAGVLLVFGICMIPWIAILLWKDDLTAEQRRQLEQERLRYERGE